MALWRSRLSFNGLSWRSGSAHVPTQRRLELCFAGQESMLLVASNVKLSYSSCSEKPMSGEQELVSIYQ